MKSACNSAVAHLIRSYRHISFPTRPIVPLFQLNFQFGVGSPNRFDGLLGQLDSADDNENFRGFLLSLRVNESREPVD